MTIRGSLKDLFTANLWSRLATRFLLRVGAVFALHFPAFRRKAAALPWTQFASGPVQLRISATTHHCRLHHTGALGERLKLAIADAGVLATDDAQAPTLHVFVRGQDDQFLFSIDTSGERLHKRGYRLEDGAAPVRETLAPGLLMLAGFDDGQAFCDPMCGSGTLAIEAALLALRRAPGLSRRFPFFDWPVFPLPVWEGVMAKAKAAICPLALPIFASDRDPQAVALARRNAERAAVDQHIVFQTAPVDLLNLPAVARGLILCNPPYGRRLTERRLSWTYRAVGQLAHRSRGFRLAVFTPQARLAAAAGCHHRLGTIHHGGLHVGLFVPPSDEKESLTLRTTFR